MGRMSVNRGSVGLRGSVNYPPVEIEEMGSDTKLQHYKNELHLLEEKK